MQIRLLPLSFDGPTPPANYYYDRYDGGDSRKWCSGPIARRAAQRGFPAVSDRRHRQMAGTGGSGSDVILGFLWNAKASLCSGNDGGPGGEGKREIGSDSCFV